MCRKDWSGIKPSSHLISPHIPSAFHPSFQRWWRDVEQWQLSPQSSPIPPPSPPPPHTDVCRRSKTPFLINPAITLRMNSCSTFPSILAPTLGNPFVSAGKVQYIETRRGKRKGIYCLEYDKYDEETEIIVSDVF